MGHGQNGLTAGDPWMTGEIIFAFIIVIVGVIWLIHRKRVASDSCNECPEVRVIEGEKEHDCSCR